MFPESRNPLILFLSLSYVVSGNSSLIPIVNPSVEEGDPPPHTHTLTVMHKKVLKVTGGGHGRSIFTDC